MAKPKVKNKKEKTKEKTKEKSKVQKLNFSGSQDTKLLKL